MDITIAKILLSSLIDYQIIQTIQSISNLNNDTQLLGEEQHAGQIVLRNKLTTLIELQKTLKEWNIKNDTA